MIWLPSVSWVRPKVGQKMLVEKVPERAVADVVQQAGQPQQRFDIAAAGHVGAFPPDCRTALGRPAGQVHDAHYVLKAGMLGRGKDPPGGLQLVNLPQPLDPGMIDDLAFGDLAAGSAGGVKAM